MNAEGPARKGIRADEGLAVDMLDLRILWVAGPSSLSKKYLPRNAKAAADLVVESMMRKETGPERKGWAYRQCQEPVSIETMEECGMGLEGDADMS